MLFNICSLIHSDPSQQMARVCYVKYLDPMSVSVAQHLTNTVFIDRAIFVKPVSDGIFFSKYSKCVSSD